MDLLEAWCAIATPVRPNLLLFFEIIIIKFINIFILFCMYIYTNINININLEFIIDNYKSLGTHIGLSISANNSS
jgi:hypothetical protein